MIGQLNIGISNITYRDNIARENCAVHLANHRGFERHLRGHSADIIAHCLHVVARHGAGASVCTSVYRVSAPQAGQRKSKVSRRQKEAAPFLANASNVLLLYAKQPFTGKYPTDAPMRRFTCPRCNAPLLRSRVNGGGVKRKNARGR